VPLHIRLGFRDKAEARASLERVLSWDFDRIVLAHGLVVETGGKALFRDAYSFLS
jgi:glyoxylase-like metal-dependent hydrolase (beta-lactamase superfamily II)